MNIEKPHYRKLPAPGSKTWIRWNCRASTFGVRRGYLQNCRRATEYFLEHFLFPRGEEARIDFKTLLREMHVLTVGRMRTVPWGSSGKYNPQAMFPRHFRHEIPGAGARLRPNYYFTAIGEILEVSGSKNFRATLLYDGKEYPTIFRAGGSSGYRSDFRIGQFRGERRYQISGQFLLAYYVDTGKEIQAGLREAERILRQIEVLRARVAKNRSSRANARRLVRALAGYYQLLLVCCPFLKQNNSLLMNQVNTVLYYSLGKCVSHGVLDIAALYLSPTAFARLFEAAVSL